MTERTWAEFYADPDFDEALKTKMLHAYVRESNKIERIHRTPSRREVAAHVFLTKQPALTIENLTEFVRAVQPNAKLRISHRLCVTVGNHVPPAGGIAIGYALDNILVRANAGDDPVVVHHDYETLHPYTDGNGRSGRAIWLWQLGPQALLNNFLTEWYYRSLQRERP